MQKIPKNYCVKTKKLYICTRNNCSLNNGEIPKWPTGADCNSADIVFVGSNPALPTYCGNSSVDRALAFQAGGRGFESRFPLTRNQAVTWKCSCFFLCLSCIVAILSQSRPQKCQKTHTNSHDKFVTPLSLRGVWLYFIVISKIGYFIPFPCRFRVKFV